ncbi:hypothetical protein L1H89_003954 [Salmonella enterica]|nr:hypothetical protein [Salmonella enterica]
MLIISFILFFTCYIASFANRKDILGIGVFVFTVFFLHKIFGAYFLSINTGLKINIWVLFFGLLYFYFWFFTFLYFSRFGLFGILFHSLGMFFISYFKIIFPLHPFILLYPYAENLLPTTKSTFLNIFLLFFLSGVMFCRCNLALRVISILVTILIILAVNPQPRETGKSNVKIAIVQVGLYFEKGGNTNQFFSDLMNFLNRHSGVNVIAFSENNFFSYKTDYNKKMSEKLMTDIKKNKLDDKYHLFLSFSGFRNFNNIVTLYHYSGTRTINQKKTLIPFIEKPGLVNSVNKINSEFYTVDKKHTNTNFKILGSSISTHICYDVLFPGAYNNKSDIVLIQSNYALLDHGFGFERLQRMATYLAKFINGLHSKIVINIQNTGGTVVLSNGWHIDNKTFELSKNEPFFIIDTSKV